MLKTTIFSVCLFASSFTIWRSEVGRMQINRRMKSWLAVTIVLGGVFIVGQGMEYWVLYRSGVTVGFDLFATTFFTLTGFHGLHVCVGLLALLIVLGVAFVAASKATTCLRLALWVITGTSSMSFGCSCSQSFTFGLCSDEKAVVELEC